MLSGLIGAALVAAIMPWRGAPNAAWRRLFEWLVVTALVASALSAAVVLVSDALVLGQFIRAAGYGAGLAAMLAQMVFGAAVWAFGYVLAAFLHRRIA
jgi:hypothetical protein